MDAASLSKGILIAVPLCLLGLKLIPLKAALRLPAAIAAGLVLGIAIVAAMPGGNLSYLVSFTTMASIYAILALGLNTQ